VGSGSVARSPSATSYAGMGTYGASLSSSTWDLRHVRAPDRDAGLGLRLHRLER
jgi:hypothetical protein